MNTVQIKSKSNKVSFNSKLNTVSVKNINITFNNYFLQSSYSATFVEEVEDE